MTRLRLSVALLATLATLLAACGSDSSDPGGSPASGTKTGAAAPAASGGGGKIDGPCDVTDQATVASVFPGAGAGKAGQVRNCEYAFGSGPLQAVNVYLYEDTTLAEFKKQAQDNNFTFKAVDVGDGAIRDQLHTLTVQQGDTLFSVQALPRDGITENKLAPYDAQSLALATKIAAKL